MTLLNPYLSAGGGGGGGGGFDPKTVHKFWIDLQASSVLFQEITGASATTPAAADGDPVGTVVNVGTGGGHFVAPATGQRPTLRIYNSTYKRLEFTTGSSHILVLSATVNLTAGWRMTALFEELSGCPAYARVFSVGPSGQADNGNVEAVFFGFDDTSTKVMMERSSNFRGQSGSGLFAKQLVEGYHLADNSDAGIVVAGTLISSGAPAVGLPTGGANQIRIGAGRQPSQYDSFSSSYFYGGGLCEGNLASGDISSTRTYMAGL